MNLLLRILFIAQAIVVCMPVHCQQINNTDQKGMKQGPWKRIYPNGNIMYQGIFRDNHPVGEFKRYNEQGRLSSVMNFSEDGKTADATLYYPDGKPASKGRYVNRQREGKWQFFSPESGYLLSEEHYTAGNRNGLSVNYYPDSIVAEKVNYVNNVKQGEWIRYHPNGKMLLRSTYAAGKLHGKFEAWFDKGQPEFVGAYRYSRREGLWRIYNSNGSLRYKIEYANGVPDNKKMEIDASKLLDSLERNSTKIPDPEKSGVVW